MTREPPERLPKPAEIRSRRPKPPVGLQIAGRRLWKLVTTAYQLRPDELVVLESAAKTLDLISDLEEGMAGQPLTVLGSQKQLREHPLISEIRAQRALAARLLAQLKLPDVVHKLEQDAERTRWARHAAMSRWNTS